MIQWQRLCFQPQSGETNFRDKRHFDEWCAEHFSDFEYENGGYIIQRADHGVEGGGAGPWWCIIIPGKTVYSGGEPDIIRFLSERHWTMDGFYAHLYLKHQERNEELFPIRGGLVRVR